jgi:hypothetical protein
VRDTHNEVKEKEKQKKERNQYKESFLRGKPIDSDGWLLDVVDDP